MLNSNTADKEAEIPLQKCVALSMARIKAHFSLQDHKVLHSLPGEAPFLNQSILIVAIHSIIATLIPVS
jgi:hypothetical protein